MVQSFFETYETYRDSAYYDASAWSVGNFYNMKYRALSSASGLGQEITSTENLINVTPVPKTNYAYLVDYNDYNATAVLHYLQEEGLTVATAFKPFTAKTNTGNVDFNLWNPHDSCITTGQKI